MPEATLKTAYADPGFHLVARDHIQPSPFNPRRTFGDGDLAELAASIAALGVLQPLVVRQIGVDSRNVPEFEIVAGERRWRAAETARSLLESEFPDGVIPTVADGLDEDEAEEEAESAARRLRIMRGQLPVIVVKMNSLEAHEARLIENMQRRQVHPVEEAEAFKRLMDEGEYDVPKLAERLGKSEEYVYARLKLLDLESEAADRFLSGEMTAGHAVMIARLPESVQREVARKVAEKGLSVRELQGLLDHLELRPKAKPPKAQPVPQERKPSDYERLQSALLELVATLIKRGLWPGFTFDDLNSCTNGEICDRVEAFCFGPAIPAPQEAASTPPVPEPEAEPEPPHSSDEGPLEETSPETAEAADPNAEADETATQSASPGTAERAPEGAEAVTSVTAEAPEAQGQEAESEASVPPAEDEASSPAEFPAEDFCKFPDINGYPFYGFFAEGRARLYGQGSDRDGQLVRLPTGDERYLKLLYEVPAANGDAGFDLLDTWLKVHIAGVPEEEAIKGKGEPAESSVPPVPRVERKDDGAALVFVEFGGKVESVAFSASEAKGCDDAFLTEAAVVFLEDEGGSADAPKLPEYEHLEGYAGNTDLLKIKLSDGSWSEPTYPLTAEVKEKGVEFFVREMAGEAAVDAEEGEGE